MKTALDDIARKMDEVRAEYEARGFTVVVDPEPGQVPFDLGSYRPRLLMERGDQHYLVEVRHDAVYVSVDLLKEVTGAVCKHHGWHFLLVTADDVPVGAPGIYEALPSWPKLRRRAGNALELAARTTHNPEASLLALWACLEGILRKTAQRLALPVERLPTTALLAQLHDFGALSMQHYDVLTDVIEVRDRVAFGYEAAEHVVQAAIRSLVAIVPELLPNVERKAA